MDRMHRDSVEGKLKFFAYTPKQWDESDVDIKILYCGVCASDLHTMSSGWGPVDYPQVVGHEIVGVAVRVGKEVTHIKEGDICGVGAQNDSCGKCGQCTNDREPYCDEGQVGTYAGVYKKGVYWLSTRFSPKASSSSPSPGVALTISLTLLPISLSGLSTGNGKVLLGALIQWVWTDKPVVHRATSRTAVTPTTIALRLTLSSRSPMALIPPSRRLCSVAV